MPLVARPRAGASPLVLATGAVMAGLLLFGVLDARRRSASAPAVTARTSDFGPGADVPTLYIPPEPVAVLPTRMLPAAPIPAPAVPEPRAVAPHVIEAPVAQVPSYTPSPSFPSGSPIDPPRRATSGPALVVDTSTGGAAPPKEGQTNTSDGSEDENRTATRARAGSMANRSTTVPQGTLIPAVLETAFDSSRAGFARALVQRDIRGFDGARVLIPRGSRLIGEYKSDATAGQNRALVNWTRLIRPDGATIAIGSPATDTVGTGGVKAKVNSHFLERFAGAILQSTLDIGVNLASRSANGAVVVALPGSLQGVTSTVRPTQIPPTLQVRQGTSISVFVARDLDFTQVEGQ